MSPSAPIRWAIRGCGAISADFVNAFKSTVTAGDHTVVALCAADKQRCRQFANDHLVNAADVQVYDNEVDMYKAGGYGKRK